jgi:hypothetical protein
LKKVERKCYTLTLAPLHLDFKLKSKWIWLKLKMDPGPTKKSSDPRKIKNADPGPVPNLVGSGLEPGSGHARSFLPARDVVASPDCRMCDTAENKFLFFNIFI